MITALPAVARIRGFDWTYAVNGCRVDLAAYIGNGSCDCEAFTEVALKCLEGGARASDATRCSHILACWEFVRDHESERLFDMRAPRVPDYRDDKRIGI